MSWSSNGARIALASWVLLTASGGCASSSEVFGPDENAGGSAGSGGGVVTGTGGTPFPTEPQPGDAWLQPGHDAARTKRSTSTVGSSPTVRWTASLDEDANYVTPVIDADGSVYVTTYPHLYAFDSEGALRWKHESFVPEGGSFGFWEVAIQANGNLVTAEASCLVRSFSPEGTELFSVFLDASACYINGPPAIGADGTIYVTSTPYNSAPVLHALSPAGEQLWEVELASQELLATAAAIDAEGSLYVSLSGLGPVPGDRVVKVSADGQVVWSLSTKARPRLPAIEPSGSLWIVRLQEVGDNGPNVHLVSADGVVTANVDLSYSVIASPPAIDVAGNAYMGMAWGIVAATKTGEQLWKIPSGPPPNKEFSCWGSGALDANGTLVLSDSTGMLYGVKDGKVVFSVMRQDQGYGQLSDAIAIGPDGTIHTGSRGKLIYAIR